MAPIANLTVRVSAQIAEFQKSFEDASKTAKKFADDFEGVATRAATVGAFFGSIAADIAGSLARGLGSALRDAVKFSSDFSNAFLGLGSVARHFGTDTDLATKAARALSADGLLPLKDSATGLKNLLATGFNLDQATKLMGAFKDSAAFGRQGALSFGDAIRSATEGVKNGNSILVDNAGITKNLSQILVEAGFSAQDLSKASTDVGVRMALYNGILKESAAFSGDAAKLTQTYTGQVTRLESAYNNTLATIGTVITQNATVAKVIGAVGDALLGVNAGLSNNRAGFNLVSDAVIAFVGVIAGSVRALDTVQGAFNTIDTAIVTFTSHVLEGVKTLADQLINLVRIAAQIPGGSLAIGAMSKEIVGLLAISKGAGIELGTLGTRIKENDDRSARWHSSLSGLGDSLDALKGNLEATRGKTVELGASSDAAGTQLDKGIGGGSKKAAAEAKKLADQLQETRNDIFDLDRKIGHFGDAFFDRIDELVRRVEGVPLLEKGREWAEALKVPGVAAKVLADEALRRELGGVLDQLQDKFGSLKNVGLDALSSIAIATTKLPPIVPLTSLPGQNVGEPIPPKIIESQLSQVFSSIPKLLMDAFTGGGGLIGAFKAIGVKIADAIVTPILSGLNKVQTAAISAGSAAASAFGGAAGGGLGASVAGIASGLGGAALAASGWGTAMASAGVAGTVALSAATLGIGAAAVGAAVLIKHFTDHKGRDAVKDFAASFGGFDALRAKLIDLGDEGERLWIRLTQGTGRGNPKDAAAAAQGIVDALANSPKGLAAAAGFHTRDEFLAVEAQAKKTYDAMLASGQFTASELARAFDAYGAAQKAAMEDGGAAVDAAAEKIRDLSAEFDSLSKSVSAEAPEEVMGVIEQQQRARMAAIAEEKTAIQLQADEELKARIETQRQIESDTKDSHDRIQQFFNDNEFEVPYRYKPMNSIPGAAGVDIPALGTGGIVRRPTLALVGERGPEAVVPLSQFGGGGPGQMLHVQLTMPNGRVILEEVVKAGHEVGAW